MPATTEQPTRDAVESAYADRHVIAQQLLTQISEMLLDKMPSPDQANWGHVGTLGDVCDRLSDIRAFVESSK